MYQIEGKIAAILDLGTHVTIYFGYYFDIDSNTTVDCSKDILKHINVGETIQVLVDEDKTVIQLKVIR